MKHIFLAYFALNKRMENLTIFDQNNGLTSFEKLKIFDFLNFLFHSLERHFSFLKYRETRFPGFLAYNKRVEKLTIFDQNHWLTPLKKFQVFNFFKWLFLWCRKMFFHSRLSWNTFSWPLLPKIKTWKNCHFLTETMD